MIADWELRDPINRLINKLSEIGPARYDESLNEMLTKLIVAIHTVYRTTEMVEQISLIQQAENRISEAGERIVELLKDPL